MSIVKYTNKKTGVVYVYESESYWDKEKKQSRNRRKLIGKLDENGNIVPTSTRGRPRKKADENVSSLEVTELEKKAQKYKDDLLEAQQEVLRLKAENRELKNRLYSLQKGLKELEVYFKGIEK